MGVAIFVDLDNIKPSLESIEKIASKYGEVKQRWAFANSHTVRIAYGKQLRTLNYRLQLTPDERVIKNDVDNLIISQIRESVINSIENIDTVVIVSNDNDFAEIANELKSDSIKTVAVGTTIGQKFVSAATYVESLSELLSPVYIGIDLGTTNTTVAIANPTLTGHWKPNNFQFMVIDENHSIINSNLVPSSICINWPDYEVGGHVRSQYAAASDRTILAWKHDLGRYEESGPFRYKIENLNINSDEPKYEFLKQLAQTKTLLPEEAAACVLHFCLEKLRREIKEINGVVITHPASFETDAIAAIKSAAVMAGWPEEGIVTVSEPQAALYDYLNRIQHGEIYSNFDLRNKTKIVVYDLGGGTLDISMHEVQWNSDKNVFEIADIAIGSRTRVGGDNFDRLIRDFVISKISNEDNYKKLSDREKEDLSNELLIYSEKFKRTWGYEYEREGNTNYKLNFMGSFLKGKYPIRIPISYDLMVKILEPLLRNDLEFDKVYELDTPDCFDTDLFSDPKNFNTLIVPIIEMFLKIKERNNEIIKPDFVLLNGGVTNFPIVKERLKKFFGEIPIVNNGLPEYAVSRGAALYAAGVQGKIRQRVNPTNIYLEVKKNHQPLLMCIVAQGQKYPYTSTLKNLKLPDSSNGEILFNIWVGMGTRKNNNTTLQRQRVITVEKFKKAGFLPSRPINLRVEYTSEENLILTAFDPVNPQKSLEFEVKNSTPIKIVNEIKANKNGKLNLQQIKRNRTLNKAENIESVKYLNPSILFSVVASLCRNSHDNFIKNEYKAVLQKAANCSNRIEVLEKIFDDLRKQSSSQYHRKYYLNKIIVEILKKSDPNELKVFQIESLYKAWLLNELEIHQCFGYLNQLLTSYLETIGHLNWNGLDDKLFPLYHKFKHSGLLISWLNAIGKTGEPSAQNLQLLQSVILTSNKVGVKDKAIWSFARLISPLQPDAYKCDFRKNYSKALTIIEKLLNSPQPYQIAPNLTILIYQVAAWKIFGEELPYSVFEMISDYKMLQSKIEYNFNLRYNSSIYSSVTQKLSKLGVLLNYDSQSIEDKQEAEQYLLEILKD